MNANKLSRKYLRTIHKSLRGSYLPKKQILEDLSENLSDYLTETPHATIEDIYCQFGSPQHYKKEAFVAMNAQHLRKRITIHNTVISTIIAVCIIFSAVLIQRTVRTSQKAVSKYTYLPNDEDPIVIYKAFSTTPAHRGNGE